MHKSHLASLIIMVGIAGFFVAHIVASRQPERIQDTSASSYQSKKSPFLERIGDLVVLGEEALQFIPATIEPSATRSGWKRIVQEDTGISFEFPEDEWKIGLYSKVPKILPFHPRDPSLDLGGGAPVLAIDFVIEDEFSAARCSFYRDEIPPDALGLSSTTVVLGGKNFTAYEGVIDQFERGQGTGSIILGQQEGFCLIFFNKIGRLDFTREIFEFLETFEFNN